MAVVPVSFAGDVKASDWEMALQSPATWDVFVGEHADGALWMGWALAKQLAARGERVRLYSEQLPLLARRLAGVDGQLELQQVEGVTICRGARAADAWPANTVLQVLGAQLPSAYLHRLLHRSVESRWLQLESMEGGRTTTKPMTPLEECFGCRSFLVQVGDAPNHGGYLHLTSPLPAVGPSGRLGRAVAWQSGSKRLGLKGATGGECFTIFADVSGERLVKHLLDHWRLSQAAVKVIIERPESSGISAYGADTSSSGGEGGSPAVEVQVLEFPLWTWAEAEEALRSADLALIGDPVSCVRTASFGIPLIPVLPESLDDDTVVRWYCDGANPEVAGPLFELAQWRGDRLVLPRLWVQYMARWDAMVIHARHVAQRIARAPDLTETVLSR